MLLFVSALKLVAEIALMCLLGQWLLGLLAGAKRDSNPIYQLFQVLTKPFIQAARFIAPKQILDRHMPLVAACLMFFVWLCALILKINVCLELGMEVCR
ncbi:MAG: hypothetical protein ACOVOX_02700 [Burkholderiaceae bacterium]